MGTPNTLEASDRPPLGRFMRAVADMDTASKLAIICVMFGWFFMNTFVVSLSSLEHGVRFVDMSAVIADPTRLFFGGDTPFHRFFFGALCIACLIAPLASSLSRSRAADLGPLAPIALIAVCGLLLFWRTSGDLLTAPADAKSVSGSFVRFANDLVHHGSAAVSRHIAVGAGGYLAAIGALVLAVRGVRRLRAPAG